MLTTATFWVERQSNAISCTTERIGLFTPAELITRDDPSTRSASSGNRVVSSPVTVAPVSTMKAYGPAPFSITATTVRAPLEGRIDTVTVCGDSADTGTAANESRMTTKRRAQ